MIYTKKYLVNKEGDMMLKYIKYEIRGTYKYVLGIMALVLILITGLYTYVNRVARTGEMSTLGNIFIALSVLIIFGTALATFLYIVGSFRKELYDDRGYLTLTLPLTGNQIVGSKLIVAILWFVILGIGIACYNVVMAYSFSSVELNISELFSMIAQAISIREVAFIILYAGFNLVSMLILIYFSMALGRVTFRNKKIGGLWFVIFLVLSGILAYGQFMIGELLPYYIDLNTFNIGDMNTLGSQTIMEMDNGIVVSTNTGMLITNISANIYNIITTVALFIGTGYLIERKIDL